MSGISEYRFSDGVFHGHGLPKIQAMMPCMFYTSFFKTLPLKECVINLIIYSYLDIENQIRWFDHHIYIEYLTNIFLKTVKIILNKTRMHNVP